MADYSLIFGVAHPIYNNRFNIMRKMTSTLSVALAATSKFPRIVDIEDGGPAHLNGFFGHQNTGTKLEPNEAGNVCKYLFGPSTHASNLNAVEIQSPKGGGASAMTIAAANQTVGSGLDDLTSGGIYYGAGNATFTIVVDTTGGTDTFKWKKDAGGYTTGIAMTGSAQTIFDGVTVTWDATTGHDLNDEWEIDTTVGYWIETTLQAGVKYSYKVGDPVTLLGLGIPDGWFSGEGTTYNNLSPWGRIIKRSSHNDLYALRLMTSPASNAAVSLRMQPFIPAHVYRIDVFTKMDNVTFGPVAYVREDATINSSSVINIAVSSSWLNSSNTFQSLDVQQNNADFVIVQNSSGSSDEIEIKGIAITHAGNATVASDYDSDYLNGIITLDAIPNRGITVKRMTKTSGRLPKTHGRFRHREVANLMVLPVTRYSITYSVNNLSERDLRKLNHLMDWQNRGHLINHFPALTGLPPCLTGRFVFGGTRRHFIHDVDSSIGQITFEEVAI